MIEPQVETTPAPVAEAPDTTTQKREHENPATIDDTAGPKSDAKGGEGSGHKPGGKGRS